MTGGVRLLLDRTAATSRSTFRAPAAASSTCWATCASPAMAATGAFLRSSTWLGTCCASAQAPQCGHSSRSDAVLQHGRGAVISTLRGRTRLTSTSSSSAAVTIIPSAEGLPRRSILARRRMIAAPERNPWLLRRRIRPEVDQQREGARAVHIQRWRRALTFPKPFRLRDAAAGRNQPRGCDACADTSAPAGRLRHERDVDRSAQAEAVRHRAPVSARDGTLVVRMGEQRLRGTGDVVPWRSLSAGAQRTGVPVKGSGPTPSCAANPRRAPPAPPWRDQHGRRRHERRCRPMPRPQPRVRW